MKSFDALENYKLPTNELMDLLSVYKLIGSNKFYQETLIEKEAHFNKKALEEDTFAIVKYLNLSVSHERMRLIITKDSLPRSKEEQMVASVKRVISSIRENASINKSPINSIDILDYLKCIFGNKVSLNKDDFKIHGSGKKSIRYTFNNVLDSYDECITLNKYEPITLSVITIMEMYNIMPYSDYNDLALILTYYYLLLKCDIISFNYVGFFKEVFARKEQLITALAKGSVNYDLGTLYFTSFLEETLSLIKASYEELNLLKMNKYGSAARKSDYIELAILNDVPDLFSKEDIVKLYPDVSLSTITRVLSKLHKQNYIIPLGTGRSAKWKRIYNKNDEKYLFGEL